MLNSHILFKRSELRALVEIHGIGDLNHPDEPFSNKLTIDEVNLNLCDKLPIV